MYDKVILPGFKLFGNLDTVTQKEEKEKKGKRRRKLEQNNRFVRKKERQ